MEDITMLENALLAYVNIKNHVFDNADINFDNEYEFRLQIDKSAYPYYKYKLIVERKNAIPIPKGFWGKNISSLNVILGKNGAGKTSIFRFLTQNLIPLTAMSGEGILYIIRYNDIFLYFTNIKKECFEIDNSLGLKIFCGVDYIRTNNAKSSQLYRNNYIWKSTIMYSNSLDLEYVAPDNKICVDATANSRIKAGIEKIVADSLPCNFIEKELLKHDNLRILEYYNDIDFKNYAKKINIKLPHAICIRIFEQINQEYINLLKSTYSDKFPNSRFIGHNRYSLRNEYGYHEESSRFEFEAAINKFSFILMSSLLNEGIITQDVFDLFLEHLEKAYENDIIDFVTNLLSERNVSEYCKEKGYADILKILSDKEKYYVLYWQSDSELVIKWDEKDIPSIKNILSKDFDFFECEFARIDNNGYYSAGERSKLELFLSLYEARNRIDQDTKGVNNNILLIMDEYDVGFHPDSQIKCISEIIEMIEVIFEKFVVQIILATNTPLEITDIPAQAILFLKDRKVISSQSNMQSFAGNVCNLLKDSFFISTTMGDFARNKINSVIAFINGENNNITHEEARFIISNIGEPIIKRKLEEMYKSKFSNTHDSINFYTDKLSALKKKIENDPNINAQTGSDALSMLENLRSILTDKDGD